MPRVRWAVRCRGHHTDGSPCQSWAIRGGFVCRVHGGSLGRTRHAAIVRLTEIVSRREFNAAWAKYQQRLTDWQVNRVLVTADLLGIPIEDVVPIDFVICRMEYGVPAALEDAPQFKDIPRDKRYAPFYRKGSADPRRRTSRGAR